MSALDSARLIDVSLVLTSFIAVMFGLDAPLTHYDDAVYVANSTAVLGAPGLGGLADIWNSSRAWRGEFFEYFPLRDTVYWFVYQCTQLRPLTFHLSSLFFHIIATLLSFRLALSLGLERLAAALTAFIFACHPIHTEAVLWAAALKDPMYTAFMLGSLLAYVRYRERLSPLWYALSIGALVAALLVKSMAIATPALMAAVELGMSPRSRWQTSIARLTGPFLITALFLTQFILIGRANGMIVPPHGGSWTAHFVLSAWAQVLYLKQAFVPSSFRMIYCFDPPTSLLDPRLLVALVGVIVVGVLAFWWRRQPLHLFLMGWYCICMLPSANILPIPPTLDDRYLYAATFGLGGLIALLVTSLEEHFARLSAAMIVLVLLGTSALQSTVWQNEATIWAEEETDPACMTDPSFLATNVHVLRYWTDPNRFDALEAYDRALRTAGVPTSSVQCAGRVEAMLEAVHLGRVDLAERWAGPLVKRCPASVDAWNALMQVALHRRPAFAAEAASRAWRLSRTPKAAILRAITAAALGDSAARSWAREAVETAPQETCVTLMYWAVDADTAASDLLVDSLFSCSAYTPARQASWLIGSTRGGPSSQTIGM